MDHLNTHPLKQKPSATFGDLNDVPLGSSAVFEFERLKQRTSQEKVGSESTVETRGFPSPFFNGFGFVGYRFRLPSE